MILLTPLYPISCLRPTDRTKIFGTIQYLKLLSWNSITFSMNPYKINDNYSGLQRLQLSQQI